MSYTALYRKFRPLTFSEIVGQEHITRTLKNQITSKRVGHAYLFNGGRGTGKTSAAKVLARAINCLNPKEGEPCNECEICKAALNGSITDIVEMDAASNNSVEDIRSIREEVNFLPTTCQYRVYIIDEVHMLSTGAFNALLKTLEEPPEHVKFILATTEPQKLPATILSRCQRFDFKKISNEDIIKRLEIVCTQSNIEITKEALNIIAILSEGAMRDALSILERCMQDGENKIDEDKIKDLVGIPKFTYVNALVKNILQYNIEESLQTIDAVVNDGKDIVNFLWEIIKYIKDLLLLKTSGDEGIYSKEEKSQMQELITLASKEKLVQLIYRLSQIENDIKWSSQKLIMFQTGIIRLCSKQENQGIEELIKRVNDLEKQIQSGNVRTKAPIHSTNLVTENKSKPKQTDSVSNVKTSSINTSSIKSESYWNDIIANFKANGKIMLYTNLMNTRAKKISDVTIGVEFPNGITSFGKTVLERPENRQEIENELSKIHGKPMNVKFIDLKENTDNKQQNADGIEALVKDLDIPINIVEE